VQKTFNHNKIQNTSIIRDNVPVLNILMDRSPFYIVIYRSYKLLKMVHFGLTLHLSVTISVL